MKENDRFFVDMVEHGILSISTNGAVRNNKTGRNIGAIGSGGYYKISVKDHSVGKIRHMQIHRLVFLIYSGDIPEKLQINHIDANKFNNDISNLELVTNTQNHSHAASMGLMNYCQAEDNGQSKLKNDDVVEIRKTYSTGGVTITDLASKYCVSKTAISYAIKQKTYKSVKSEYDYISAQMLTNNAKPNTIAPSVVDEIKRLHRDEGLSSYKIADKLRINRNTVMKYW